MLWSDLGTVTLLLTLSCLFDSCPNFECYEFSLVERRRSEDSVVGVGWLLLDILCSFFLHSPVHVSFLAPPIPLMAYHASMGVGGVVRLVFLFPSLRFMPISLTLMILSYHVTSGWSTLV